MENGDSVTYPLPWEGNILKMVQSLQTKARKALEGHRIPDDVRKSAFLRPAPFLLVNDGDIPEQQRELINVLNVIPNALTEKQLLYFETAMAEEERGHTLSYLIHRMIEMSRHVAVYDGEKIESAMGRFLNHLILPIISNSAHANMPSHASTSPAEKIGYMDPKQHIENRFHGRSPLHEISWPIFLSGFKDPDIMASIQVNNAVDKRIEIELAQFLVKQWREITPEMMTRFAKAVEEYNLVWALASFEWGCTP